MPLQRSILRKLEAWAQNPARKPLVLRGARQVGKTTLVNEFAKQFDQYLYLNLEIKNDRDLQQRQKIGFCKKAHFPAHPAPGEKGNVQCQKIDSEQEKFFKFRRHNFRIQEIRIQEIRRE